MGDREDEMAFMKDPMQWPRWPFLPVKRRHSNGAVQVGLMLEVGDGVPPTVYQCSMYQLNDLKNAEKIVYLDFEGLLDDGWVVD